MRLAPAIPGMPPRCLPVWQPLAAHSEAGAAWSKWANFITNCLTSNESKLKTCPFPFSAWSHDNQSYQSSTPYDTILYTLKIVWYILENAFFRFKQTFFYVFRRKIVDDDRENYFLESEMRFYSTVCSGLSCNYKLLNFFLDHIDSLYFISTPISLYKILPFWIFKFTLFSLATVQNILRNIFKNFSSMFQKHSTWKYLAPIPKSFVSYFAF